MVPAGTGVVNAGLATMGPVVVVVAAVVAAAPGSASSDDVVTGKSVDPAVETTVEDGCCVAEGSVPSTGCVLVVVVAFAAALGSMGTLQKSGSGLASDAGG